MGILHEAAEVGLALQVKSVPAHVGWKEMIFNVSSNPNHSGKAYSLYKEINNNKAYSLNKIWIKYSETRLQELSEKMNS